MHMPVDIPRAGFCARFAPLFLMFAFDGLTRPFPDASYAFPGDLVEIILIYVRYQRCISQIQWLIISQKSVLYLVASFF